MAFEDDFAARYARQIMLAEVGHEGQERVLATTACVAGSGLAHRIAELYARRAGFAAIAVGAIDRDRLAPLALVAHPAAREVLAGSRAALAAFRKAILRTESGR